MLKPRLTYGIGLVVIWFWATGIPVFAQTGVDRQEKLAGGLSAAAREVWLRPDASLQLSTRLTPNGRIQTATGIYRAVYDPSVDSKSSSNLTDTPAERARTYLRRQADRLGLPEDLGGLHLAEVKESPGGYHVIFQQQVDGRPVYRSRIRVNLDRRYHPVSIYNSYRPEVSRLSGRDAITGPPSLSRQQVRDRIRSAVSPDGPRSVQIDKLTLVVYPSTPPCLAWTAVAWTNDTPAEWSVVIDARDGKLIRWVNQATRLHDFSDSARTSDPRRVRKIRRNNTSRISPAGVSPSPASVAEGTGLVFDPDPITTSGEPYGGAYADNGDSNTEALSRELLQVPLPRLQSNADGEYVLEGPYVTITGVTATGGTNYDPPSEVRPHDFQYTRAHNDFEAVNAYYHIHQSQRYVDSLGYGTFASPAVEVNPHGEGQADNSFYYPNRHLLSFGQGGVDDAEDADVLRHEYAHALLDRLAPGLLDTPRGSEARIFHEGWGDYWAGSYRRNLQYVRSRLPSYDWRRLFPWDGNLPFWPGRYIAHRGRYSEDLTCPGGGCNIYTDGLLWAATMMELFSVLAAYEGDPVQARSVLNRIHLQANLSVPVDNFRMSDAASELLNADRTLYQGEHVRLIRRALVDRGFLEPVTGRPYLSFRAMADGARLSGRWRMDSGGGWSLDGAGVQNGNQATSISSVVFPPIFLSTNSDTLKHFVLTHRFDLGPAAGGNLKVTTDGGENWHVVRPLANYPGIISPESSHSLAGEPGFVGSGGRGSVHQTTFDLTSYQGRQIQLRIDFADVSVSDGVSSWTVREAQILEVAQEGPLVPSEKLTLHPNFPDPFTTSTTVSFTLPDEARVGLYLFDVQGRRRQVLLDERRHRGTHTVTVDGTALSSGTYYIRMVTPGQELVEPIVRIR